MNQTLGVLATSDGGQPYGSLVAYAATADLGALLFATARATHKFANLTTDPRASLVVDSRGSGVADFYLASAATAVGAAVEVNTRREPLELELYLARHPHLDGFVSSPTCALLRLTVDRYYFVTRFQTVIELRPDP